MKKLRIFGIALMAIVVSMAFVACSDDDDNFDSVEKILVGKWKLERTKLTNPGEMDLDDATIEEIWYYMTFKSDGTGIEIREMDGARHDFKWEVIDDKLYLQYDVDVYDRERYDIVKYNQKVIFARRSSDGKAASKFVKM